MRPVMQLMSIGVRDQAVSRRFYAEGLGWPTSNDQFDDVTFVVLEQGPALSLWSLDAMQAEIGPVTVPAPGTSAPMTLAHVVDSPAAVDDVLAAAEAAGAVEVHQGRQREWGGYSGYFVDPDGYRWEIAHNPGLIRDADGTVHVGAV